jgi:hypothetical protein
MIMELHNLVERAKKGLPVFLHEVQQAFQEYETSFPHTIVLELFNGGRRLFPLEIPGYDNLDEDEIDLVESFVLARIYNILSAWGGKRITIYCDIDDKWYSRLFSKLSDVFQIPKLRSERTGYGKVINVTERMIENFSETNGQPARFAIYVRPISDYSIQSTNATRKVFSKGEIIQRFRDTTQLDEKLICGMDIGGTDIKIAVSRGEHILFFKEYDWNPASFTKVDQLIDPIMLLVELMLVHLSAKHHPLKLSDKQWTLLESAMDRSSSLSDVRRAIIAAKEVLQKDEILLFDAIGLCFPDIVIRNKIVGGEVYKTRGIRNNRKVDYEVDFRKLSDLHLSLRKFCTNDHSVHMTNDGAMAAFTAGVEMAFSADADRISDGVFAHTLGTELGSGWIDELGQIPELPLEIYNFIIDLGSFPQRDYGSDDLRSINNFNTGLPGTLQKYTSQSGVFRLAVHYFKEHRPDLYRDLVTQGFVFEKKIEEGEVLMVPTQPQDMRKPFLEHIMRLTGSKHVAECEQIFQEMGRYLAETWFEIEQILNPTAKDRFLFGRLVKDTHCFSLMQEGFSTMVSDANLVVADDSLANTPLMRQLKEHEEYTVAQFAQAVGAIHFANLRF